GCPGNSMKVSRVRRGIEHTERTPCEDTRQALQQPGGSTMNALTGITSIPGPTVPGAVTPSPTSGHGNADAFAGALRAAFFAFTPTPPQGQPQAPPVPATPTPSPE